MFTRSQGSYPGPESPDFEGELVHCQTSRSSIMADLEEATRVQETKMMPPPLCPRSATPIESDQSGSDDERPSSPGGRRPTPTLEYEEPEWGGMPPAGYCLEVLKNGTIVEQGSLAGRSTFLMGRWTDCHLPMEHPSLSRYHALLQYRAQADADHPVGFYLYDLGSTHGTYHNKNRCFPRQYYRLRVGHTFKLGGSSRLIFLQGPPDDQDPESDQGAKELMEEANRKKAALQIQARAEAGEAPDPAADSGGPGGISWGMPEDAVEDEEEQPNMDQNPFALGEKTDESLYIDDPKKTLRGWFERESLDLEYNTVEQAYATFKCTIVLPLETGAMTAEAVVKGKKKEAVVQCALEACRILDRLGQLRQSHQESRAKRVGKKWEEDDFYASDEDEFLDRTGSIEKKRQVRMRMVGKTETTAVETYESLSAKVANIIVEKATVQSELEAVRLAKQTSDQSEEDLDAFMANLKSDKDHDKTMINKLKLKLAELNKECQRLERLVEIARPTSLPKLEPATTPTDNTASKFKGILVGKRGSAHRLRQLPETQPLVTATEKAVDLTEIDALLEVKPKGKTPTDEPAEAEPLPISSESSVIEMDCSTEKSAKPSSAEASSDPIQTHPPSPEKDAPMEEKAVVKRKRTKLDNSVKKALKRATEAEDPLKVEGDYDSRDPKYAVWMPPEGQTGDGRTSLNEKLGY